MKVLLFDIDGTLMLSGGAGLRAMNKAFIDVYHVKDALAGVNLAGRTDTSIIEDALEKFSIPFDPSVFQSYKECYYNYLNEEIQKPIGDKYLMPGIKELLPRLVEHDDVYLGLLTGNWQKSGRIKINYFGLNDYFSFGAFADDSGIRNELLPFAIDRFKQQYKLEPDPRDVFVIGDTPADIHCAKPHDAVSIAVGAAHYTVDQLKEHEPDFVFKDLTDTERFLEILG